MNIEALERRVAALEARAFDMSRVLNTVVIGSLEWHKASSPERMTFKAAQEYVANLKTDGHTDWRLPTIQELLSLVDYTRFDPAIDIAQFPDTKSTYYWSSSPDASSPAGCAWFVGFGGGLADCGHRDNAAFVRAVRSVAPVTP